MLLISRVAELVKDLLRGDVCALSIFFQLESLK